MKKSFVLVLLFSALAACGDHDLVSHSIAVTVDTVAGVIHVQNAGVAPEWELRSIFTVGSEGSTGEAADDEFGRVASLLLAPEGDLYVADVIKSEIRVFGSDGDFKNAIGREGQGPGEFWALFSIAWMGSSLLALDYGNARVGEIGPDGNWVGQRPAPGRITGNVSLLRLYAVGPGEIYAWSLVAHSTGTSRIFVKHGVSGIEGEILQASQPDGPPSGIMCDISGGMSFFSIPFGPKFLQHPFPGEMIAATWTENYRVFLLSSEHDTVRVVERVEEVVPVSAEEWESELEPYRSFLNETPGAVCRPRSPSKPTNKPAINDILVDVEGRIWIEASTATGYRWDIFDSDGAQIASLRSFPRSRRVPPYLGHDRIAYVVEDSLGVQRVQVSEIGIRR